MQMPHAQGGTTAAVGEALSRATMGELRDRGSLAADGPLAGLIVLGGMEAGRAKLSHWGALCLTQEDEAALRDALAVPGAAALLWLPPGHLPVRPPGAIAAALLDGADHAGTTPGQGWCLTPATAGRVLRATPAETHAALLEAGGKLAPAPCHAAPFPMRLPDLPAAFASGRPFAGPFDKGDPMPAARALNATEPGARRPIPPRLPAALRPLGPPPLLQPGEIVALIVARNEALRLPDALAVARAQGVDRAIVIDNGSSDGTQEVARSAGAHVILAEEEYAASNFGVTWTNAVLDAYARGHWALVIDADEQLVFPGSDRVGLRALTEHLDALGSEALRTILLDCFPEGPLAETEYRPGEPLLDAAPMFEPARYRQEPIADFPHSLDYGGIRERLFFPEADPRRPTRWLRQKAYNIGLRVPGLRHSSRFARLSPPRSPTVTKLPLLRWRDGAALVASTHRVAPMAIAEEQPTGVLLHFKFLQDFHARAVDAVARGAHYDGSREYRRYLARIEADPRFSLAGPQALAYAGPSQLVQLGLMADTQAWRMARETG
jgi:hypothetical protein